MTALKSKHAQQNIQMDQKAMTDVFVTERERETEMWFQIGHKSTANTRKTQVWIVPEYPKEILDMGLR